MGNPGSLLVPGRRDRRLTGTRELLAAGHQTLNQVTGQACDTGIMAGEVFGGIRIGGLPDLAA